MKQCICFFLGFYLRRTMVHLDRLTFVQIVSLYKSFCSYYQRGRPGLMMRSLSKEVRFIIWTYVIVLKVSYLCTLNPLCVTNLVVYFYDGDCKLKDEF